MPDEQVEQGKEVVSNFEENWENLCADIELNENIDTGDASQHHMETDTVDNAETQSSVSDVSSNINVIVRQPEIQQIIAGVDQQQLASAIASIAKEKLEVDAVPQAPEVTSNMNTDTTANSHDNIEQVQSNGQMDANSGTSAGQLMMQPPPLTANMIPTGEFSLNTLFMYNRAMNELKKLP